MRPAGVTSGAGESIPDILLIHRHGGAENPSKSKYNGAMKSNSDSNWQPIGSLAEELLRKAQEKKSAK